MFSHLPLVCAAATIFPLASLFTKGACTPPNDHAIISHGKYNSAVFRSTHNSYSGDIHGERGSIHAQLHAGVRFIELDVHAPDFSASSSADFRIGHSKPGHEVATGSGNPNSTDLSAWLRVVSDWISEAELQDRERGAPAVITLGLDLKSPLSASSDQSRGGLVDLNRRVEAVFDERLVTPAEFDMLSKRSRENSPPLEALRGRVVVVISGDLASRTGYRWDRGMRPAVALNSDGWVVEVHSAPGFFSRQLLYWVGRLRNGGGVDWVDHGVYASGVSPAVALNDDGTVVAVHAAWWGPVLMYRLGILDKGTGRLEWKASGTYDEGVNPTVAFESRGSHSVREIHSSMLSSQRWERFGDIVGDELTWFRVNTKTNSPAFEKSTATLPSGASISVDTAAKPVKNTLVYRGKSPQSSESGGRITHRQIMFVEYQIGNQEELADDGIVFYAINANKVTDKITTQSGPRILLRAWGFKNSAHKYPAFSFPATDEPYSDWYEEFCANHQAVVY